jgi:hypothetical protein
MRILKNISFDRILVLVTCFLLSAILIRSSILFLQHSSTSYGLTEWLINYEGGFTRRGLLGQLLFLVHENIFLKVNYIVLMLCIFLYLYIFYFFIIKLNKTFPILFLLSPLMLGMPILTDFFIRKDILGLLLLIFLVYICKSKLKSLNFFICINSIYILSILVNETIFFYSFLIIFLFILERKKIYEKVLNNIISTLLILSPSLIIFLILIIYNANFEGSSAIHNSWENLWSAISPQDCCDYEMGGEILALENEKINFFNLYNLIKNYPTNILAWLITIFTSFVFIINFLKESQIKKKYLLKILIVQLISLLPLFFFAGDWGRWIFFWISSTMIAYIYNINLNYNFLKLLDVFCNKLITKKIFNIKMKPIYLLFIGFPMVHYQWSLFNYYMTTIFGKLSAIIFKILTKGISVYF